MNRFNLNNIEQIITLYLIFNFIIAICLLYLILSVIFRIVFKNEKKKRKKDIVELFWEKDKESKAKTIFKRIFLIHDFSLINIIKRTIVDKFSLIIQQFLHNYKYKFMIFYFTSFLFLLFFFIRFFVKIISHNFKNLLLYS